MTRFEPAGVSFDASTPPPAAPVMAWVATTSQCNLTCLHCPRTIPAVAARADAKPDMSDAAFAKFEAQVLPTLDYVILGGPNLGEPTYSNRFDDQIERLAQGARGPHVSLQTNGTGLTRARLEQLVKMGARLLLSMEGVTPATYERFRGWPFDRLSKSLGIFNELRDAYPESGAQLYISSFVVRYDTLGELMPLVDFAVDYRVDVICVTNFMPYLDSLRDLALCNHPTEANAAFERAAAYARERGVLLLLPEPFAVGDDPDAAELPEHAPPCFRPWTSVCVDESSNVKACPCSRTVLGNLKENDLDTIWNGPRFQAFRRQVNSGNPAGECKGCLMRGIHAGETPGARTHTDSRFLMRIGRRDL